jgi:hypothetical protein
VTTVLSVGNSEGERRCDARCHDAGKTECDCVCGGRYHGKGRRQVLDQVQDDVVDGVFGETVAIAGRRALANARERSPERVRFHERAVRRDRYRAEQAEVRLALEGGSS